MASEQPTDLTLFLELHNTVQRSQKWSLCHKLFMRANLRITFFFKLKSELVFENQVIKGTKQHMVAYIW